MASTLVECTEMLSLDTIWPKKYTFSSQTSHFLSLAYSLCSFSIFNAIHKWSACSSSVNHYELVEEGFKDPAYQVYEEDRGIS